MWILLICAKYGIFYDIKIFKFFCRVQAIVVVAGILYGVYSLFLGSLTSSLKSKVLSLNANGYALFKWANSNLDKEDVVLSIHKSISLGKSNYISTDFIPYVDFNDERSEKLIKLINEKNPNYLLTWGYNNKPYLFVFENCVGDIVYFKKNVGKFEARNPLNRGNNYNGYIFKFKTKELPKCIKN